MPQKKHSALSSSENGKKSNEEERPKKGCGLTVALAQLLHLLVLGIKRYVKQDSGIDTN